MIEKKTLTVPSGIGLLTNGLENSTSKLKRFEEGGDLLVDIGELIDEEDLRDVYFRPVKHYLPNEVASFIDFSLLFVIHCLINNYNS